MPVQQDQLTPTNTNTNFETFNAELPTANSDWVDRVLHNGTDILKATLWGKSGQSITPKFKYYQTNGVEKVSYTPEKSQLLDVCYDAANAKYYTVRLINNLTLTGVGPSPDDDFTYPESSILFDSRKWFQTLQELQANFQGTGHPALDPSPFLKTASGELLFNAAVTPVNKYLKSRYIFSQDWEATMDFNATTLTGSKVASFGLHAVDATTNNHVYGVGITHSGGDALYYNTKVTSFVKSSSATLKEIFLDISALPSGSVSWTLSKIDSGNWNLSNTLGLSTSTPVPTNQDTYILPTSSGVMMVLSGGFSASIGDLFTFTTEMTLAARGSSSGTLYLTKATNDYSSSNSISFDETISWSDSQAIVIEGRTTTLNISASVSADNFNISTGSPEYVNYPVLNFERIDEQGTVQANVVQYFDVLDSFNSLPSLVSGTVAIAVSPSQVMYAKVFDRIYSFTATGNLTGVTNSGSIGIVVSDSGVIPASGITSFMYNDLGGTSLNYVVYDTNTSEVRYKSLSTAQPPVPLAKEIFLDIPDYNEHRTASGTKPYQLFLHATDPNSLFYVRKNGVTNTNTLKVTGTSTGVVSSPILTDTSKNFITSNVKKGDLVTGTSGAFNGITVVVKTVVNATTLELMDRNTGGTPTITAGTYSYTVRGNADLLQFNIDPTISAFSAVNADDYSLQAGTNDTATVSVEVINAWGESLNGKNVSFQLVQGDGVINPPSAVTSGAGLATTQYTAGASAGPVQIQVTISD